jgi:CRISPR/Cas system-associated endoribonuclease Cas2
MYVITYDLRSRKDRTSLFATLQSFGPSSHFMASAWLISTSTPRARVAATLQSHLDRQDSIFVSRLSDVDAAYLPPQAAEWAVRQRDLQKPCHEKLSRRPAA